MLSQYEIVKLKQISKQTVAIIEQYVIAQVIKSNSRSSENFLS